MRKAFLAIVAIVTIGSSTVPKLLAQETFLAGTPARTYMKARTDAVLITSAPLKAFNTSAVNCPTQCFLDITVSIQVSGVTPGSVAAVSVLLDGSQSEVLPYSALGFDSTSNGGASNVRSYTWMTAPLSSG